MAIELTELLRVLRKLEKENIKTTLLGIGPMSRRVVQAALELGAEKDFPVMLIASRNQVDLPEYGGGYVAGWDQASFVETVQALAEEVGFTGLLYICRDHGGPWQRDEELRQKLPFAAAMKRSKQSFFADVTSGFNVLHIDPTKDPHSQDGPSLGTVIERVIELTSAVEGHASSTGIKNSGFINYEIGTEETAGGIIDPQPFAHFLAQITNWCKKNGLEKPAFIVGQTGTLVKMNTNVGSFDPETARILAAEARAVGVGFKEHNADYLSDEILQMHPELGITAANVAPEFGAAETKAYLELADYEAQVLAEQPAGKEKGSSNFREMLETKVLASGRWRKWLPVGKQDYTAEQLLGDRALFDEIIRGCGHYVFEEAIFKQREQELFENIKAHKPEVDPERFILDRIKQSIDRYVRAFALEGITGKVLAEVEKIGKE